MSVFLFNTARSHSHRYFVKTYLLILILEIPGYILLDISVFTNYHRLGDLKQLEFVILQIYGSGMWHTSQWTSIKVSTELHFFPEFQGRNDFCAFFQFSEATPFLGSWSSSSNFKARKVNLSLHIGSLKSSLLSLDFKYPHDYSRNSWIIQDDFSI